MANKIFQIFLVFLRIFSVFLINSFPDYFSNIALNDAIGFSIKAEMANNFNLNNIIQTIKWNIYPFFRSNLFLINQIFMWIFLTIMFGLYLFYFFIELLLLRLSKSSNFNVNI